jgi:hypothetical protein
MCCNRLVPIEHHRNEVQQHYSDLDSDGFVITGQHHPFYGPGGLVDYRLVRGDTLDSLRKVEVKTKCQI